MAHLLQRTARRPMGYGVIVEKESGKILSEHETFMCCHCQMHFMIRRETDEIVNRGWCRNCMGPICGKKRCFDRCDPWEKAIERMEARGSLEKSLRRIKDL